MNTRILVIEDNPDNLELMTYLLKQFGYDILTATDGMTGLSLAKESIPDLIICDIRLPGLNGYEIAERLKSDKKYKKIPLIAVTAYSMVGDKDHIMSKGYDGYISKPIDPEKFVSHIEAFLPDEKRSIKRSEKTSPNDPEKESNIESSHKPSVLVVDDAYENQELSRTLFESINCRVSVTDNVYMAFKLLEKMQFDLILSDLHLPVINGIDFIKKLKSESTTREIPVILISSSQPTKEEQRECLNLGAVKFILRPIDAETFLNIIRTVFQNIKQYNNQSGS